MKWVFNPFSGTFDATRSIGDTSYVMVDSKDNPDVDATDTLGETAFWEVPSLLSYFTLDECLFIPDNTLTADDTDYVTFTLYSRESDGTGQVELGSFDSTTTDSGDWTEFNPITLTLIGDLVDVPAGYILTWEMSKAGAGVIVPSGELILRGHFSAAPTAAPSAPTNLVATVNGPYQIDLEWDDNSSIETGYSIEVDTVEVDTVAANETTYSITGLDASTEYDIRVRAFNANGYSGYSNTETKTTDSEGYQYGYPAHGAVEPNVAAQWLLDEASGNIVDEVTGLTIIEAGAGTPTYSVAAIGDWVNLSPGITIDANQEFFQNAGAAAALNFGTDDAVFEFVKATTAASDTPYVVFDTRDTTNVRGWGIGFEPVSKKAKVFLKAEDDTIHNITATASAVTVNDGVPHKYRYVFDRDGNFEIFVDGVSAGTTSLATTSGKTINANAVCFPALYSSTTYGNYYGLGTYYELRLTVGNTTNNSGGPGGG